jgi:solute:Na+ symporter, SSS family
LPDREHACPEEKKAEVVNFMDLKELWSGIDWLIIVLYFVGILLVGVSMKKRAGKSVKSFYVASRKLTVPILIGVGAAGWYDSWTIVGLAECGWTMGISVILVFVIPEAILRLPLATIIGPHVRDKIPDWVVTVPDMMKYLYSGKIKLISAVTYIANLLYDSALLFAIAEVLKLVSGMPMVVSLIVAGAVIAIYTALSGLWGLAVTDLIQFAIMTVAVGTLMVGIIVKYDGLPVIWENVRAINPDLLTPTGNLSVWESIAWAISACAMYCEAACYQKFGSARSGDDIKTAYSIMLAMGVTFSTAMVIAGMAALAFFTDAASPATGFWSMVFTVLPVGFRGLFVAALCAAVMSTVSSDWLLFSTCAVNDIYRGFINSSRNYLLGRRHCERMVLSRRIPLLNVLRSDCSRSVLQEEDHAGGNDMHCILSNNVCTVGVHPRVPLGTAVKCSSIGYRRHHLLHNM